MAGDRGHFTFISIHVRKWIVIPLGRTATHIHLNKSIHVWPALCFSQISWKIGHGCEITFIYAWYKIPQFRNQAWLDKTMMPFHFDWTNMHIVSMQLTWKDVLSGCFTKTTPQKWIYIDGVIDTCDIAKCTHSVNSRANRGNVCDIRDLSLELGLSGVTNVRTENNNNNKHNNDEATFEKALPETAHKERLRNKSARSCSFQWVDWKSETQERTIQLSSIQCIVNYLGFLKFDSFGILWMLLMVDNSYNIQH